MIAFFLRRLLKADGPLFALMQSMSAQLVALALNVGTGIVTARALGAEGRGEFAAVTTWPQMVTFLAMSGIGSGVLVLQCRSKEPNGAYAGAGLAIAFVTTMLAAAGAWLLLPTLLQRYSTDVQHLAALTLLAAFANSLSLFMMQVLPVTGAFRLLNTAVILAPACYLASLAVAWTSGHLTVPVAVACLVGSGLVSIVVVLPRFWKAIKPAFPTRSKVDAVLRYVVRAAPTDFISTLVSFLDRLVLIPLVTPREAGLYVVAYSFSRVIFVVQPAINAVVLPHLARREREGVAELFGLVFRLMVHGALAAILALLLIDKPLLSLAYGADFEQAAPIFRILVLEAGLGCLAHITTQVFYALDRPGYVSSVQTGSFFVVAGAMLLLVPHFQALGAALALLSATTFKLAMLYGGLYWSLKLPRSRIALARADLDFVRTRLGGST